MQDRRPVRQNLQERGFHFACEVLSLYQRLSASNRVPRRLANQILGSGTSIGANLEEAQSAQSLWDLRSKYAIALKEARETRYWLRLLTESRLVNPTEVAFLLTETKELIAILTACVRRIHRDRKRR
jgi:four helix bundle protein